MNHQINQFTQIFNEALDLPVHEREAYVKSVCGTNSTLCARLLDLLKSAEEASLFFSDLQENLYQSVSTTHDLTNTEILNYKVSEKLGEGGMATVYKAKRSDGLYENEVALKVFDKDVHHPELAQKFEYERKILASLTHPNIAQIIDAGATPEGNPFYILEYVAGQNVLSYVQHKKLNVKQTLELFLKVAKAVQFAHQNFIIHRDLKPANVLVNARGEPKLLDFGIAKILDNSSLPATQTQALMLTPDYASPEQLVGGTITTATDVYLLGLLLYELITFEKPFHSQGQNLLKIHQSRQGQKALAPLKKVKQSGLSRNTTGISGDLDTIVAKMLAYETQERYTNVQSLVEDMEALLANQPIKARPASWGYKTKKYLKRNPAIAGLSLFMVTATLVFSLIYVININKALSKATQATKTAQAFQKKAENETKVSKQVSGFLEDLFIANHPDNAQGKEITVKQLLHKGYEKIKKEELAPEVKVRLLFTMAKTLRTSNEYLKAEEALNIATRLYKKIPSPSPLLLSNIYHLKAVLSRNLDRIDSAIVYSRKSIKTLESIPVKSKKELKMLSKTSSQLAFIYYKSGKNTEEALTLTKKSLKLQKKVYEGSHFEIVGTLFVIANLYRAKKNYKMGEKYQRQSLTMCQEIYKDPHPCATVNLNNLSFFLRKQKKYKATHETLQKALTIGKKLFGEKHREIAIIYLNIGHTYKDQKKYDKARTAYNKALLMFKDIFGEEHSLYTSTKKYIAHAYIDEETPQSAIPLLKKNIQINQKKKRSENLASNYYYLGRAYMQTKQYPLAKSFLEKALSYYHTQENKTALAEVNHALGTFFYQQKEYAQAESWLLKAFKIYKKEPNLPDQIRPTLKALVKLYKATQQPQKQAQYQQLLDQ